MTKFKTIMVKEEIWKVLKEVSELTNTSITEILEDFALNLKLAMKYRSQYANKFTLAFTFDKEKRLILIKLFEIIFGTALNDKEMKKQIENQLTKINEERKERGVKC